MPVVCVRLSEQALEALDAEAAKGGQDRSSWLREVVQAHLGVEPKDVESILPPPPQMVEPMYPGDELFVGGTGPIHP